MCVHLVTNASLLGGAGRFQANVNMIHNLGPLLPLIEWGFIFSPIIFHAVVGVWIATSGHSNTHQYPYIANRRYSWQRITGYIAFVFIFIHVFHLHGWFHAQWWLDNVAEPLGMAQFRPYNAASTLATAMTGIVWPIFYAVGVLSCCFHLANGIWTAGITWGVWLTPAAQRRATVACTVFGCLLSIVGLSSLWAVKTTKIDEAVKIEDAMYEARVESKEISDEPHKRSGSHPAPRPTPEVGKVISPLKNSAALE
jgi:succinate dehydrogenase / fumarate reductase cytochrome b subunit